MGSGVDDVTAGGVVIRVGPATGPSEPNGMISTVGPDGLGPTVTNVGFGVSNAGARATDGSDVGNGSDFISPIFAVRAHL